MSSSKSLVWSAYLPASSNIYCDPLVHVLLRTPTSYCYFISMRHFHASDSSWVGQKSVGRVRLIESGGSNPEGHSSSVLATPSVSLNNDCICRGIVSSSYPREAPSCGKMIVITYPHAVCRLDYSQSQSLVPLQESASELFGRVG